MAFRGKQSRTTEKAPVSFPFLTLSHGVCAQTLQTVCRVLPGPTASGPLPRTFPHRQAEGLAGLSWPWGHFSTQNNLMQGQFGSLAPHPVFPLPKLTVLRAPVAQTWV